MRASTDPICRVIGLDGESDSAHKRAMSATNLATPVPDIEKNVASGRDSLNRGRNKLNLRFHDAPVVRAQDQQRDSAARQVLLVTDFLIGGDEQIKTSFLGRRQQRPILESGPALEPRWL